MTTPTIHKEGSEMSAEFRWYVQTCGPGIGLDQVLWLVLWHGEERMLLGHAIPVGDGTWVARSDASSFGYVPDKPGGSMVTIRDNLTSLDLAHAALVEWGDRHSSIMADIWNAS